jgi:uncharacterized membrane protein YjfL (UPF0719 family)
MTFELPQHFPADILATMAFGLLATLLVIAGYKLFDRIVTKVDFDEELKNGNRAIAIVVAAFILGLCYVIANVVTAILN